MAASAKTRKDIDMTQGVIWKQLLLFALPLMVGNLFQQLYNTVDSIVVGNFVGKEALAAVGSVGPIINSLIGFFTGLATGAGVVISQAYGAKNSEKVSRTVHTTLSLTLLLCLLFTFIGIAMTPMMLRLMSTPEDVFGESAAYLRIYFAGVSGLMIYNMGAGILRAVGDSRRPLYFLIFSACTNTVLDLLFVAVLRWGIAGVAWATVLSQVISAVLIMIVLMRTDGPYRLELKKLRLEIPILREVVRVGLPAAIQQMITSISNVFVQSYINMFGSSVMAGWSAYSKIDQFMMLPMMSVSLAATTFVGQNRGAGRLDRIKKGANTAFFMSLTVSLLAMAPLLIFAPSLVGLFNSEAEVLSYGVLFIRTLSPFYMLCCINQVYASSLRGLGNTRAPMFIMLGSFVVFRQIYLFIVSRVHPTVLA
ncbi:MAG: MATE family efflux transporter, partial [Oscillospiraceae bacterium]|nr:MATE family efflux transporter [Oscillospiraceae bacterium]